MCDRLGCTRPEAAVTLECHCDAKDVPHTHDWIVWFAHRVATEDARQARLPGSAWCLMLREHEAHALRDALVARDAIDREQP